MQLEGDHAQRPVWARPAWRERILVSLPERLAWYGCRLTALPAAVCVWECGAVLRLPTDQGNLYLKFVPSLFRHEPVLTAGLGAQYLGTVPDVLDVADGMLMRDYGRAPLIAQPDLALWEAGLRAYARLQVSLIDCRDDLRGLAVPERSLAWMQQMEIRWEMANMLAYNLRLALCEVDRPDGKV